MAAHRAGIRRVILPEENRKDLEDVPENVRAEMTFGPEEGYDDNGVSAPFCQKIAFGLMIGIELAVNK